MTPASPVTEFVPMPMAFTTPSAFSRASAASPSPVAPSHAWSGSCR